MKKHLSDIGPLIEWKQRFYAPFIQSCHFARKNSSCLLTVSNESGDFQLHTRNRKTGVTHQITKEKSGKLFGLISPGGEFIYYLNDTDDDEVGHFVRVPFIGGKAVDITPDLPAYSSFEISFSDDGNLLGFIASFKNKNQAFVLSLNKDSSFGVPQLIFESENLLSGPMFSSKGDQVFFGESFSSQNKSRLIQCSPHDYSSVKIIGEYTEELIPLDYVMMNSKSYLLTTSNISGWRHPMLVTIEDGVQVHIPIEFPQGDVVPLRWSDTGKYLLACHSYHAQELLLLCDIEKATAINIGPKKGSFDLFYGAGMIDENKKIVTVRWQDSVTPPTLIDISLKKSENFSFVFPLQKEEKIVSHRQSVWFSSSDGMQVQGWLNLPTKTGKPIPFIIGLHGGPHAVAGDMYSPECQAWLDHGFGYLEINYRGSIGFGKKFEEGIKGNPGFFEVEDTVAAREWLIENEFADPGYIILQGWSWGGFVALLAAGKYPNLWNGCISIMGIADWFTQYQEEPSFFKAIDRDLFGGTPDEMPERYKDSSPTTYAHSISSPLLVLHGRNDSRCPASQMEKLDQLMKEDNKKIILEWFDAGHAGQFADVNVRIANMEKSVIFAQNIKKSSP